MAEFWCINGDVETLTEQQFPGADIELILSKWRTGAKWDLSDLDSGRYEYTWDNDYEKAVFEFYMDNFLVPDRKD